jgi:hypothetical protein
VSQASQSSRRLGVQPEFVSVAPAAGSGSSGGAQAPALTKKRSGRWEDSADEVRGVLTTKKSFTKRGSPV